MKPFVKYLWILLIIFLFSCSPEKTETVKQTKTEVPSPRIDKIQQYAQQHQDNGLPSRSLGTVGNGQLENGKLLPFGGINYQYFDTSSYLAGHAFVHEKVKKTVLDAYSKLENAVPRNFFVMECANETGGRIFPHRTHQNGLSVDFMMPLEKNGQPYYGLDSCGQVHYLLDFDDQGRYSKDTSIHIDFDAMALHLQALHLSARKFNLRINKVILKIELKDDFFKSTKGKETSGFYFVQQLTPLINALHDDHYHVDFELIK